MTDCGKAQPINLACLFLGLRLISYRYRMSRPLVVHNDFWLFFKRCHEIKKMANISSLPRKGRLKWKTGVSRLQDKKAIKAENEKLKYFRTCR
jgi:hypothetical protein